MEDAIAEHHVERPTFDDLDDAREAGEARAAVELPRAGLEE
jgi:hypothetical protein